jgi:F-type H+-transporting ATPase subunit delta
MQDTVAARKYAKSLFAEAQAKNQLLACQQGLEEIVRVCRLRRSLKEILVHPFIPSQEKQRMIHSALGEYSTPLLEQFLFLLVRKRRFELLFLIAQEFQEEVDRFHNIQPLRVRVAFSMSEANQKHLKEHLEKWLGSKVRMDVEVDPALIGGLVIQTKDQVLDQSLRGQLKRLQAQLTA